MPSTAIVEPCKWVWTEMSTGAYTPIQERRTSSATKTVIAYHTLAQTASVVYPVARASGRIDAGMPSVPLADLTSGAAAA